MLDYKERIRYLFDSLKTLMTINAGLLTFLALNTDFKKLNEREQEGTALFCIILAIIFGVHLFLLMLFQNLVQSTDEEGMKRLIKNYEEILKYSSSTHLTLAFIGTLVSFKGHETFVFLETGVNKTIFTILAVCIVIIVPLAAEKIVSAVHRSK